MFIQRETKEPKSSISKERSLDNEPSIKSCPSSEKSISASTLTLNEFILSEKSESFLDRSPNKDAPERKTSRDEALSIKSDNDSASLRLILSFIKALFVNSPGLA